jgi:hypothetical protein
MTPRLAIGFVCVLAIGFVGLALTLTFMGMKDTINEKLPPDKQLPFVAETLSEIRANRQVHRTYQRLYPDGPLLARASRLSAAMLVLLLIGGWLFYFPPVGLAWLGIVGGVGLWLSYRR